MKLWLTGQCICSSVHILFPMLVCIFLKRSQGAAVKSPSHKAPWYPALRHSQTISRLMSLGLIPPPSDHLALRHCGGKCGYSLASHSSLKEQVVERQEPLREKIKKKKKRTGQMQGNGGTQHIQYIGKGRWVESTMRYRWKWWGCHGRSRVMAVMREQATSNFRQSFHCGGIIPLKHN